MTEEFIKNPMYKNINSSAIINNTPKNDNLNNTPKNDNLNNTPKNDNLNNDKQFLSILDEVINLFEKLKIS